MPRQFLIPLFLLITLCACSEESTPPDNDGDGGISATAWLTSGDGSRRLDPLGERNFAAGGQEPAEVVSIDPGQTFQTMQGFGAALTNSSAWLIEASGSREAIIADLFSRETGIGISYARLPMGASDFTAVPAYTYNDLPAGQSDPDLSEFSIDPDRAFILPVLKDALAARPDLKVIGSPWSAPAWMKSPATLNGGSLRTQYHGVYADYFVRFVQAYAAEGVTVDAITVQNEPLHSTNDYPTMLMQAGQQADFIADHLGPALAAAGLATRIYAYDHNWDRPDYPLAILGDVNARRYVAGTAWHCYGGSVDAQSTVRDAHPDKDVIFTECSGGEWDSDFGNVLMWNMRNLFIGSVRNWSSAVLLWNLALDAQNGPHRGGCGNCRGVVTVRSDGTWERNVEYYTIGHFSRFVQPGAVRIASDTYPGSLESVAFRNPDGTLVAVVMNATGSSRDVAIRRDGNLLTWPDVPARSVLTVTWAE